MTEGESGRYKFSDVRLTIDGKAIEGFAPGDERLVLEVHPDCTQCGEECGADRKWVWVTNEGANERACHTACLGDHLESGDE